MFRRRVLLTVSVAILTLSICVAADAQTAPNDIWSVDAGSGVHAVAYSPDGSLVASGNAALQVQLWRANDGVFDREFPGQNSDFLDLAFSPDGAYLAAGAIAIGSSYPVASGVTDLWDLNTGELIDSFSGGWTGFSADGTRLMAAGGGIIRDVNVYRLSDSVRLASIYTGTYITAAALAPSGQVAASADYDGNVEIWNVDSESLIHAVVHGGAPVRALTFSPDGTLLASGGQTSQVKVWNAATGELVHTLDHGGFVTAVAFSPTGTALISTGTTDGIGRSMRFWEVASGAPSAMLQTGTGLPYGAAWSPDGGDYVYGLGDGSVALAVSPVSAAVPGDWDHNGSVDLADYVPFHDCLSGAGVLPQPQNTDAPSCLAVFDFDDDEDVDVADFAGFQAAFGA